MENNLMDRDLLPHIDSFLQLRKWVNFSIDQEFRSVSELFSGVIYCLLVNKIFDDVVPLEEIFPITDQLAEIRVNFEILQTSFDELQIPLSVPVDDLAELDFYANLRFAAEFYDVFKYFCPIYGNNTLRSG
ncbi:microtubule-associated protein RP/EB family member 1-like [Drosophila eugracilis]|uniref:microtubule-associated protein RP/EB family member 1-like n=1 Tax=Drosophila eugracilis TaxID=29029 RepID=UPI0007E6CFCD|nr:microtubule-associated protein RP/EB family member 1-like [Drosophila eugracilis]